jgi:type II secretory pathway predicted ATPase ExeA
MASNFDRGGRPDNPPGVLVPVPHDPRTAGLTYEPFYGLREKPFSLTSDARFFYQSRSHAPAFDDLLNAIRRRESLNVLTGDIGTGKTTLCRAVLESLDRKTFSAFVPDPFASREDLLKILLIDFGVVSIDDVTSGRLRAASRTELSYLLYEFLGTLAPLQAFAVVIIDEAQNLSVPLLEETRILSDADGQLQVVLVGQLEFREKLKLPEMRQLQQRVSVHCQLSALDLAGVAGYIAHRLRQAGGSPDRVKFSGDAVEAIYELSGGVPRIINRVCDRALRHGYARRAATIDREILEAANPFESDEMPAPPAPAVVAPPLPVRPAPIAAAAPPVVRPAPVTAAAPPPVRPAPVAAAPPPPVPPAPVADAPPPVPALAMLVFPAESDVEPVAAAPAPSPVAAVPVVASAPVVDALPAPSLGVPAPAELAPSTPAAPAVAISEPAPGTTRPPLPERLEDWLTEIEKQPEAEPVPVDWRERWAPTNAVAPEPEPRSGVRFRIRSGPQSKQLTQTERLTRRFTRKMAALAIALVVLFGALVLGPASIGASIDLWSELVERFTPPSEPDLPSRPRMRLPAPLQLPPPPTDDELQMLPLPPSSGG